MWKVYLSNLIFPGMDEFLFGSRFMGAIMMFLNAMSLGLAFMLAREFNELLGMSLMVLICAVNTFRVYKDWQYK